MSLLCSKPAENNEILVCIPKADNKYTFWVCSQLFAGRSPISRKAREDRHTARGWPCSSLLLSTFSLYFSLHENENHQAFSIN